MTQCHVFRARSVGMDDAKIRPIILRSNIDHAGWKFGRRIEGAVWMLFLAISQPSSSDIEITVGVQVAFSVVLSNSKAVKEHWAV